jgi:hypothetical protein
MFNRLMALVFRFKYYVRFGAGPAQGLGDIGPRLGQHFSWIIFMYKKKIFNKIFTR